VLLDTKSGDIYSCNGTASAFLSAIDGTRSISEICVDLAAEYEVTPQVLHDDMVELTADLVSQGLLTTV